MFHIYFAVHDPVLQNLFCNIIHIKQCYIYRIQFKACNQLFPRFSNLAGKKSSRFIFKMLCNATKYVN